MHNNRLQAEELRLKENSSVGNYEAAINGFRAVMLADPADEQASAGIMRAYLETGRYQEAEDLAGKVLSKKSNNAPNVRAALAEALATTGRYGPAILEFELAAKASPNLTRQQRWKAICDAANCCFSPGKRN
ncbi:MAG: bacterial transcriptional activator domain-containing protein [Pyrinomonadaceae bacterium]